MIGERTIETHVQESSLFLMYFSIIYLFIYSFFYLFERLTKVTENISRFGWFLETTIESMTS